MISGQYLGNALTMALHPVTLLHCIKTRYVAGRKSDGKIENCTLLGYYVVFNGKGNGKLKDYCSMPCNTSERRSSHQYHGGSLKSPMEEFFAVKKWTHFL
jgi:hypothetical protein